MFTDTALMERFSKEACRCCENPFSSSGPICWECVVGRIGCKNCMDVADVLVKTPASKVHIMKTADRTKCGIKVTDRWFSILPAPDLNFCSVC